MSTMMYGVRVLDVDRDDLRVRLKVFAVYYDTDSMSFPGVPETGLLFFALWERAPLVELDHLLDFEWVDANARRFVSRVELVASANHPPTDGHWERLDDFYYLRDGGWKDEDLLIQFEYDVWVTDPRWLEPLKPGDAWQTAAFPLTADTWTAEDAPHLPDFERPATVLTVDSFSSLAFSDDGRYLAVCNPKGQVGVYDTTDWSQVGQAPAGDDWYLPRLMWVPGEHVVTVKSHPEYVSPRPQWAFNVITGTEVDAPVQLGFTRSRDGVHRIDKDDESNDVLFTDGTARGPDAVPWKDVSYRAFTGDGSRLFLDANQTLYVLDPATGEVVDTVAYDWEEEQINFAANPDGGYLAIAAPSRRHHANEPRPQHPEELCVFRLADRTIVLARELSSNVQELAWSPCGRWLAIAAGDRGRTVSVFPMGPDPDAPVPRTTLRPDAAR
jgi:hypothetical protein